jgi:hypothetical protein
LIFYKPTAIDGVFKSNVFTNLGVICFYDGRGVWVSYHQTDNETVSVLNCGRYRRHGEVPIL